MVQWKSNYKECGENGFKLHIDTRYYRTRDAISSDYIIILNICLTIG